MHYPTVLGTLGLIATAASAAPLMSRQANGALNVVYWGQNGGGTIENNDLSAYCSADSGIDVLVLAFLYEYVSSNKFSIPFIKEC